MSDTVPTMHGTHAISRGYRTQFSRTEGSYLPNGADCSMPCWAACQTGISLFFRGSRYWQTFGNSWARPWNFPRRSGQDSRNDPSRLRSTYVASGPVVPALRPTTSIEAFDSAPPVAPGRGHMAQGDEVGKSFFFDSPGTNVWTHSAPLSRGLGSSRFRPIHRASEPAVTHQNGFAGGSVKSRPLTAQATGSPSPGFRRTRRRGVRAPG
jgi:hypothetical protein